MTEKQQLIQIVFIPGAIVFILGWVIWLIMESKEEHSGWPGAIVMFLGGVYLTIMPLILMY